MIFDSLDSLNWLAVATAAITAFVIGLLWFSPITFGTLWARQVSAYTAIPQAEITNKAGRPKVLLVWLAAIALSAVTLAITAEAVGAQSAVEGAAIGLVLGIGLGATLASWPATFARMPWQWWLLNSSAFVVMQVVMGAILGGWQ